MLIAFFWLDYKAYTNDIVCVCAIPTEKVNQLLDTPILVEM